MELTYRNHYEIMDAVRKKCNTKRWPLVKGFSVWMSKIRLVTQDITDQLKEPATVTAYNTAVRKLQAELAGSPQEVINERLDLLLKEHPTASTDAQEIQDLEKDLLADSPAEPTVLTPISEQHFHDKDTLLIEKDAFMLFYGLGLVEETKAASGGNSKVTKLSRKKRRK